MFALQGQRTSGSRAGGKRFSILQAEEVPPEVEDEDHDSYDEVFKPSHGKCETNAHKKLCNTYVTSQKMSQTIQVKCQQTR